VQVVCTINYGRKGCGRHGEIAEQMKTAEDAKDAEVSGRKNDDFLSVLCVSSGVLVLALTISVQSAKINEAIPSKE
jgi:hypothetical protein